MKTRLVLFSIIALFALVAFTSVAVAQQAPVVARDESKDAVKAPMPEAVDVSGAWEWKIIPTSTRGRRVGPTFAVRLKQDSESVKGSFSCSDNCSTIVNNVPVSGDLKNGKLRLVREDMAFSEFDLTPTQDSMTGVYVGFGGVRYDVIGKRK